MWIVDGWTVTSPLRRPLSRWRSKFEQDFSSAEQPVTQKNRVPRALLSPPGGARPRMWISGCVSLERKSVKNGLTWSESSARATCNSGAAMRARMVKCQACGFWIVVIGVFCPPSPLPPPDRRWRSQLREFGPLLTKIPKTQAACDRLS